MSAPGPERPSSLPPRLFRALLSLALPARMRSDQLAELDEEYRLRRAAGEGGSGWYRWQVVRSLPHAVACRLREVRGSGTAPRVLLATLWDDAVRTLRRSPGFTALVTVLLGLGVGANAAAFSVVRAVLLEPLPYPGTDALVYVYGSGLDATNIDPWGRDLAALSQVVVHGVAEVTVEGSAAPGRTTAMPVSEGFFEMLALDPAVGRALVAGDHAATAQPAVVVSSRLAAQHFGEAQGAIGAPLLVDGRPFTVVGTMPPGFVYHRFPSTDLWLPISHWEGGGRRVLARMRDGVTPEVAAREVEVVADRIADAEASERGDVSVERLQDAVVGFHRDGLLVLSLVVGLVMLIATANVSILMLIRSERRRHERAVRIALGASRGRLARQTLAESFAFAALSTLAGTVLARWGTRVLLALQPTALPRADEIRIDPPVVVFAFAVSLGCAFLAGLAPAITLPRNLGARSGSGRVDRASARTRAGLIVGEVAIATSLLVGAGVLVRTYLILAASDPGFEWRDRLAFRLDLPEREFADAGARMATLSALRDDLARLPGVESVSLSTDLPMTTTNVAFRVAPPASGGSPADLQSVHVRAASPNYLESIGLRVTGGRGIEPTDVLGSPDVAVVNESMARAFWPDQEPLGATLRLPTVTRGEVDLLVVGVVSDAWISPGRAESRPEVYLPLAQERPAGVAFLIAGPDPASLAGPVADLVRRHAPRVPIQGPNRRFDRPRLLGDVLADAVAPWRYQVAVVGSFAALALLLATVGLHGVLSAAVGRERHAIGVRIALGGTPAGVGAAVLRRGMSLVGLGLVVGLAAAATGTRVLAAFLYGVSPTDPVTFLAVTALVAAIGATACAAPVRQATSTDPRETLYAD